MAHFHGLHAICSIPLSSLRDSRFLPAPTAATPKRFRFLDCKALLDQQLLQIFETMELKDLPYSAVSYVWRGNEPEDSNQEDISFHVEGTIRDNDKPEDKPDPIHTSVLQHTCAASIQQDCPFLWLDRLCILQSSKEDKRWQIKNMYDIYKSCKTCIVLPGGVRCIVPLETPTAWIHRSWTLQESLAPQRTLVLFAWSSGSGEILAGDEHDEIVEVVPGYSAVCSLSSMVNACAVGHLEFQRRPSNWDQGGSSEEVCRILGYKSPNVLSLGAALNDTLASDPDAHYSSIWQCALMRTSSRPVDMVLSIMGVFGVALDPNAFHADDRLSATVALARAILERGGRACWLGISLTLPLSREIPTFPVFPETTVQGKAMVDTDVGKREVAEMMEGCYPNSLGLKMALPGGSMDELGTFTTTLKFARAVPVQASDAGGALSGHTTSTPSPPTKPKSILLSLMQGKDVHGESLCQGNYYVFSSTPAHQAQMNQQSYSSSDVEERILARTGDGKLFSLSEEGDQSSEGAGPRLFALIFGWFNEYYPGASMASNRNNIRGMLVREDEPDQFHLVCFFTLDQKWRSWAMSLNSREFCIGRPRT